MKQGKHAIKNSNYTNPRSALQQYKIRFRYHIAINFCLFCTQVGTVKSFLHASVTCFDLGRVYA